MPASKAKPSEQKQPRCTLAGARCEEFGHRGRGRGGPEVIVAVGWTCYTCREGQVDPGPPLKTLSSSTRVRKTWERLQVGEEGRDACFVSG